TRFSRDWSSDVCSSDLISSGWERRAKPEQPADAEHDEPDDESELHHHDPDERADDGVCYAYFRRLGILHGIDHPPRPRVISDGRTQSHRQQEGEHDIQHELDIRKASPAVAG